VGWGCAVELARMGHEVSVITRLANQRAIEANPESRQQALRFFYYDLPGWITRWRKLPGGKAIYYALWQLFVVGRVRQLFPALPFDRVQHVTYVSVRYPSFMGSLGIPFWFGPVSGGEAVPPLLRARFSLVQRCREWLRDVSNFLIAVDPLMRRTFRQAERILVTRDTLSLIPARWRDKCTVHLAVGLSEKSSPHGRRKAVGGSAGLQLLFVGRLLHWKGVDIALRVLDQVISVYPDAIITIIGEGPAESKLKRLILKLHLEHRVRWLGSLPHESLAGHYGAADLLLFPSLRDSGGMVVLEALAHGLPVVCADLGGPGVMIDSTCGRVVPTFGRTPDQLVRDFSEAILDIVARPSLLDSLAAGAIERAQQFDFANLVRSVHPAPADTTVARQA
jgi:glycosyltransferase involved in cell wall biosynthesis